MLADPQSVTINAVAVQLPRTNLNGTNTVYTAADGNTTFSVKQSVTASRFRREVRLATQKIAADPISAVNKQIGASVYLVIDEPKYGYTDAELGFLIDALKAWFTSVNYNKILGGES